MLGLGRLWGTPTGADRSSLKLRETLSTPLCPSLPSATHLRPLAAPPGVTVGNTENRQHRCTCKTPKCVSLPVCTPSECVPVTQPAGTVRYCHGRPPFSQAGMILQVAIITSVSVEYNSFLQEALQAHP